MTGKEKEPALTRRPALTPVSGQTLAAGNHGVNACIVALPELTRESTADTTESADAELAKVRAELTALKAVLNDPVAVHANILRGTIKLTQAQALHIAGTQIGDLTENIADGETLSGLVKGLLGQQRVLSHE